MKAGHVKETFHFDLEKGCVYDEKIDHYIQTCLLFEDFVTIMIKRGIIRLPSSTPVFDVCANDQIPLQV